MNGGKVTQPPGFCNLSRTKELPCQTANCTHMKTNKRFLQEGASRRELLGGLLLGTAALMANREPAFASGALPRTAPEEVQIAPEGVIAFVEAANRMSPGLHSFMLVRHGKIAAEGWWRPYAPNHPHQLYSLSKSFTSTAVGLAVTEGRLTVEAPITSFFPDSLPAKISDNLAAMRVRHLLTMSTGHTQDATGPTVTAPDGDWVKAFLSTTIPKEPGSLFVYNSAATYMLSAIVQKLTGMTVRDYLMPRLFKPLGFETPAWDTCPKGINTGGWGLNVRTEEIARFGQLYLQGGVWQGKRLLPAAWVTEATTKKIENGTDPNSDWAQGYCYQFWRCRHGAFRGDGAFGQYCVVIPEQDAVVAITSGLNDMQGVLNLIWEHLLPAMRSASETPPASSALQEKLRGLSVPGITGQPQPEKEKAVEGKTYRFAANPLKLERLSLSFKGREPQITLADGQTERVARFGRGRWVESATPFASVPGIFAVPAGAKSAAQGGWTDADTYHIRFCFYETPYIQTLILKFSGDDVQLHAETNVGIPPSPTLTGHSS